GIAMLLLVAVTSLARTEAVADIPQDQRVCVGSTWTPVGRLNKLEDRALLASRSSVSTQLTSPRWTHVALPTGDLERAIEFYTTLTPLVVVERFEDEAGVSAWLSNDKQVETPFVLVLVGFNKDKGGQHGLLTPFAHLGIEVPNRS